MRSPLPLLLAVLLAAGCSRLYPPVVEGADATPAAAGEVSAPAPPARGARIRVLSADDPEYLTLAASGPAPAVPEGRERLLVLQDGVLVLDLGIRAASAGEQGRVALEEQVAVADDASAAVVVRVDRQARGAERASLTWLPAGDPEKAWKKALDPGRRVLLALPIPAARGLVLVTAVQDAPDDLRVHGPAGSETFHLAGAPASVLELRASPSGRYVGADLAFASRPGGPDRAIWIHDVVARTAWMHSWSYGSDEEVTAWRLLEDGTLEADTAAFTLQIGPGDRVFDRSRRRP